MDTEPEHHDHPKPTEPLRPLHYERQLAWPWSLGQTDPVKLQKFARRAALFRRLGCLIALLLIASALALLLMFARKSGAIR